MKTEKRGFLSEGEEILWTGSANKFDIQEKPFSQWNTAYWAALSIVLAVYMSAYLPEALANGSRISGILLTGFVVAFIPGILTYNSIHDCHTILTQEYFITNKRAIITYKNTFLSMELNPDTPYRIEKRPNDNQILYLGTTTDSKLAEARKLAVIGDKDTAGDYQGLVFYSIQNAEDVCKTAGLM